MRENNELDNSSRRCVGSVTRVMKKISSGSSCPSLVFSALPCLFAATATRLFSEIMIPIPLALLMLYFFEPLHSTCVSIFDVKAALRYHLAREDVANPRCQGGAALSSAVGPGEGPPDEPSSHKTREAKILQTNGAGRRRAETTNSWE